MHVVVDAAFGAAYAIAPYALRKLGATVTEINCENDGSRINVDCGATDLRPLQHAVRERIDAGERRVVGVAFDGDADRALFVDENGATVSGDHVMYAIGCSMHARGELARDAIVGTVMSNIGFERALEAPGIDLVRTAVGDRYVLERMRAGRLRFWRRAVGAYHRSAPQHHRRRPDDGGHAVRYRVRSGTTLHELVKDVVSAPQILLNVRTSHKEVLETAGVRAAIAEAEAALAGSGRLLIRLSGTEPLIRVMAEGDDRQTVEGAAARVVERIQKEIGGLTVNLTHHVREAQASRVHYACTRSLSPGHFPERGYLGRGEWAGRL